MKKVLLTPNPYRDSDFKTVLSAKKVLEAAGMEVKIALPFEMDRSFQLPKNIQFSRLDKELSGSDLIICFGGDGTILHMAKTATRAGVPILGVNNGTMGFMAEIESTELEKLSCLADNHFRLDSRMMLDVTVHRGRDIVYHDICLNDVVITKGAVAHIINLSVRCDGVQAMEVSGDGLVLATPTGSTAYSLSAGGPIVEPEAHNILLTPICAHNVTSRCMVASENRQITVALTRNARRNAYLSADGGKAFSLQMGDVVTVKKSNLQTRLVRLNERSFYDAVNTKFKYSR